MQFEEGDRVRIDIPDTTDHDKRLHGKHGVIQEVLEDDADVITGGQQSRLFRIRLESGEEVDVREWDVRKPFDP